MFPKIANARSSDSIAVCTSSKPNALTAIFACLCASAMLPMSTSTGATPAGALDGAPATLDALAFVCGTVDDAALTCEPFTTPGGGAPLFGAIPDTIDTDGGTG